MVALYRDPKGDSIFDKPNAAINGITYRNNNVLNTSDDSLDKDEIIETLRRRITELESVLSSQNNAPGS